MNFDLTSVEDACVTLPKYHCTQVSCKCIKVCGYRESGSGTKKNYNIQKVNDPKGPLDDLSLHIPRGHIGKSTQAKDYCVYY